ncbi:MAG: acyl-CoA reductase [Georgfuchsia sp.]
MHQYKSGIVIRGEYIDDNLVSFGGRSEGIEFFSPDPHKYVDRLPLGNPVKLSDLYQLSFEDILDYLVELGKKLNFDTNAHLQESYETACLTSALTPPLIKTQYQTVQHLFARGLMREAAEQSIGIEQMEGWKTTTLGDGRILSIRAFGARALHIIAGNSPLVAAMTVMRNAITRSDAIIKSPSNDPFTALAIARTMVDMAPDHPITRHLSVAYWKGGDESIEKQLYQPHVIEKLVAWGGLASVKHVTKYVQPGLELVTLDPKRSMSIIGPEALRDEATQREVAKRLASDIGSSNQEGCVSARVVYVLSGTDEQGIATLNEFGRRVYEAMLALPATLSSKPRTMNQDLKASINTARLNDEWYNVIGGEDDEGAIIVSQIPERVDFATLLANRVANLVPVGSMEEVFAAVDAYTQTVGIYPESLKKELRDQLPLYGAQRLTSLGYAGSLSLAGPQDAIEPLRRMCKWIVEESLDPKIVPPRWETGLNINAGKYK